MVVPTPSYLAPFRSPHCAHLCHITIAHRQCNKQQWQQTTTAAHDDDGHWWQHMTTAAYSDCSTAMTIGWFKDLQLNPNLNFNLTKFDWVGVQVGVRCLNAFYLRIIQASTHTSISPVVYHTIILNCTSKFLFPFMPTISEHQLFIQAKQENVSGVVLPVFEVVCVYTL